MWPALDQFFTRARRCFTPPGFGCARLATLAFAAPHPGGVKQEGRRTNYRNRFTPASCLWGVSFCDCRNGESHRSGRDSHCRFVCSHWRIGDSHCHDVSQHRCNVSSHLKVVCSHWSIVSKHWRNGDSHCPVVGSHRCNVSSHRRIVSKQWRNGRRPAQGSPRFIGAIRRL